VTNGPRGISVWYIISSVLPMGNILNFDLQESQCRVGFIGKSFFVIKYPWIVIIYPRLRSLAYQNRELSYLYSGLSFKKEMLV
jgi:hypothetical protein